MILEFFFLLKNDTYFFLIENFDTGQRKSGNFDIVPKFYENKYRFLSSFLTFIFIQKIFFYQKQKLYY